MSQQTLEIELRRLKERHEEQPEGRVFAPLSDVLRKLGRIDEALQVCLTGLARHPDYSSAHVILGKIHLERGDDESARESFEKVLEIDAHNLLALRHLARMEEGAGDYESALERWEHIRHLEPDSDAVEEHVALLVRKLSGAAPPPPAPREAPRSAAPVESAYTVSSPETEVDTDEASEEAPEAVLEAQYPPEGANEDQTDDQTDDHSDDQAEEQAEEQTAPAATLAQAGRAVPATEIATITLAEIYAEQGFKSKALEIFRQVLQRSPHLEGIAERIAELEAQRDAVEARAPRPTEASLADLEPGDEAESTPALDATTDETGETLETESVPAPPIEAPDDPTAEAERERRDHFRTWLERLKVEDS